MPTPRRSFRLLSPAFLAVVALAGACAAAGADSGTAPTEPSGSTTPTPSGSTGGGTTSDDVAGYATGTVVDASGKPLAGVRVIADNTLFYNTNAIGVTDAQGHYTINVTTPVGTWHMSAQLTRQFEGQMYTLALHPNDDTPFAGNAGGVRNFDLRLTGQRPDLGYYGNDVEFSVASGGWGDEVDPRQVEYTFTPVGPLVDGSAGKPFTLRPSDNGVRVHDVPLGKYAITARYAPAGQAAKPMVIRVRGTGNYGDTLTTTWPVDEIGAASALKLQVAAPGA